MIEEEKRRKMSRRGFLLDLIYIDYMLNLTYYDFLFVFQNNHGMIHLLKVSATFCSTFIPRSNAKKKKNLIGFLLAWLV